MLAWSLYIVRMSTIAKNPLNIVQAELYLRTGNYNLAIDSACALLDSALAIDMRPAPLNRVKF